MIAPLARNPQKRQGMMTEGPGRITAVFGQHDEKTIAQLHDVASKAAYAAHE